MGPIGFGYANSGGFEHGNSAQDLTIGDSWRIGAVAVYVDDAAFSTEHNVTAHIHDLESGHILVELAQSRHLLIEDASSRGPQKPRKGFQGFADEGCVGSRRLLHVPPHRAVAENNQHQSTEHQAHHHRKSDVTGDPCL
jgi:hypothetical protein